MWAASITRIWSWVGLAMVRQFGVWDGHCSAPQLQAHGNMEQKVDGVGITLVLSVLTDITPPVTHIPQKGHALGTIINYHYPNAQ